MVELTIIGPDRRLERTGCKPPEEASPLAAGPFKLDVGSSRRKAQEFSLWSRQSASASREAAVFDSASGSSVTGADAAAWLPVVRVLWSPRRARLRRGSVGRALAGWRYCLSGQQWLRSWPFAQPGAPGDRPHKAAAFRLSFHGWGLWEITMQKSCLCCEKKLKTEPPRVCPHCGQVFQDNGRGRYRRTLASQTGTGHAI